MNPVSTTHTYAVLEISAEAYAEIRAKLAAAGYHDQFHEDGLIDMRGLALATVIPHEPDKRPPHLTRREYEIVELICRGMTNRQIAAELSMARDTVKVHLRHIFEKAGLKNRVELALEGYRFSKP